MEIGDFKLNVVEQLCDHIVGHRAFCRVRLLLLLVGRVDALGGRVQLGQQLLLDLFGAACVC